MLDMSFHLKQVKEIKSRIKDFNLKNYVCGLEGVNDQYRINLYKELSKHEQQVA